MTPHEHPPKLSGFYAILDRDSRDLATSLASVGCALQVRLKPEGGVSTAHLLDVGRMAQRVARAAGALFVINDRVDVALALGADAVHLGQDDLPLAAARRLLTEAGSKMLIGISTHDADQVRAAVGGGADYLGYGPVYGTTTKKNPDPVRGIERLAEAVQLAGDVPVVAIGGITPERAAEVAATGAAAACAISAVNDAADVAAAGRALAMCWR